MTHIKSARPTEPALAKMDEGVAKILRHDSHHITHHYTSVTYPVPMTRLKIRKMAETKPIVRFSCGTASKDSPS